MPHDHQKGLLDVSDFLKSEAATWSLVQRVVCSDGFVDLGRALADGRLTFRQKVASVINEEDDLLMHVSTPCLFFV